MLNVHPIVTTHPILRRILMVHYNSMPMFPNDESITLRGRSSNKTEKLVEDPHIRVDSMNPKKHHERNYLVYSIRNQQIDVNLMMIMKQLEGIGCQKTVPIIEVFYINRNLDLRRIDEVCTLPRKGHTVFQLKALFLMESSKFIQGRSKVDQRINNKTKCRRRERTRERARMRKDEEAEPIKT